MELVPQASTGRDAVCSSAPAGHHPYGFPDANISGIEAIIAIRGEFNDARIVVLTTYAGPPLVVRWSGWKRRPLSHLMRRHHLCDEESPGENGASCSRPDRKAFLYP